MKNLEKLDNEFLSEFCLCPFSSSLELYEECYKRGFITWFDYISYAMSLEYLIALAHGGK